MNIENLDIFNRSYELSLKIHKITLNFPKIEQYGGIADQLRRSSKSIPANITEGYAKRYIYPQEFKRFLSTALGSCEETELWLMMSKDLGYIKDQEFKKLSSEYSQIGKMIVSFIKKL